MKKIVWVLNFAFLMLIAQDLFAASNYKEIRSLRQEKKSLTDKYKRKQKELALEELSGITMRLHTIQTELDRLTGGKRLSSAEVEALSRRKKSPNRSFPSSSDY